jgi:hypothetical protein
MVIPNKKLSMLNSFGKDIGRMCHKSHVEFKSQARRVVQNLNEFSLEVFQNFLPTLLSRWHVLQPLIDGNA